MKKSILTVFAVLTSLIITAQGLENKIPNNADVVVAINGSNLIQLVPTDIFDEYSFTQEIFRDINRKRDSLYEISSIDELGFDLNSKGYYFYKHTDSIEYHNLLFKLSDKDKFESFISEIIDKKVVESGYNFIEDHSSITMWNDEFLLFTGFEEEYDYFDYDALMTKEEYQDMSFYEVKNLLASQWAKAYTVNIFNSNNQGSNFKVDDNKAASAWITDYNRLMLGVLSYVDPLNLAANYASGIESLKADLYFEGNTSKLVLETTVNPEFQKVFEKIYDSKMNKTFYNYLDVDNLLGYASVSMNSQAMIEEYPYIIESSYSMIYPEYKDEISLGTDLLAIFLDEEAIGGLATGDGLFILDDIETRMVTYTEYDYDENYEMIEYTSEKEEQVPSFTFMIGTKEKDFLYKVGKWGAKKEVLEEGNGYYKFTPGRELPVDVYTAVKNDILFFTTSEEKIQDILDGKITRNPGAHKKIINANSSVMYVNTKKLIAKIPEESLNAEEEQAADFAQKTFDDIYFKGSRIKGNKILMEMDLHTSNEEQNALRSFLDYLHLVVED